MRWINSLKWFKAFAAGLMCLTLVACQSAGQKEQLATVGGAIIGGLLGAQLGKGKGNAAATAAGAVIGAMVGREIGASLDELDRRKLADAQIGAANAPLGETITWNNPNSGNFGAVTSTRDGNERSTGRYCREFHNTVVIDGEEHEEIGKACQNEDGSWEIVS